MGDKYEVRKIISQHQLAIDNLKKVQEEHHRKIQHQINEHRAKIASLRKQEKKADRNVNDMIQRYEQRCEDGGEWCRERLVRNGESFDEWWNRVASKCRGSMEPHWKNVVARDEYNKGGLGADFYYTKWLVETRDERIKNTVVFQENT